MKPPDRTGTAPQSRGGSALRLRSVRNVRTFIACELRRLRDRVDDFEMPAEQINATRVLIYGAQVLATLIRDEDLERRIVQLEKGRTADEDRPAH